MDWAKTTGRRHGENLTFGICCVLYQRLDSIDFSDFTILVLFTSGSTMEQTIRSKHI